MDLGLQGKVALVTGGSRGIGRALSRRFADEGAYVVVTYHTGVEPAKALAGEIREAGGQLMTLPMDLASMDSIEKGVRTIETNLGRIDILVNNAYDFGSKRIADSPNFEDMSPEIWQRLLRINIEGTLRVTQMVVPSMRRQKWGRIVHISATLAEDGLPGAAWYAVTKSSLHGLTRTLSKELGPAGILVNTVMPGLTATDRLALLPPTRLDRIENSLPIRRVLQPQEVADITVFLCSSVNSVITGEIIRVSGGRL